ncbi:MAG: aspartate dehydrogenase [Beijerinckiaceae bacterium]
MKPSLDIALIGYGTIARLALETLAAEAPGAIGKLIVVSRESGRQRAVNMIEEIGAGLARETVLATGIEEALASKPGLVVEAAGHGALCQHGPAALASGTDLIVTSVGALADDALRNALDEASERSGALYNIIPGAVGGLDILAAAKLSGLTRVVYTSRKPPAAWAGTAAEKMTDLTSITHETVFFRGDAGQAARMFPQNANVAATIALKGAGFAATQVELVADPAVSRNVHELNVEAGSADFTIRIEGRPAPGNPKTSLTTAYSLAQSIIEHMNRSRLRSPSAA